MQALSNSDFWDLTKFNGWNHSLNNGSLTPNPFLTDRVVEIDWKHGSEGLYQDPHEIYVHNVGYDNPAGRGYSVGASAAIWGIVVWQLGSLWLNYNHMNPYLKKVRVFMMALTLGLFY